jgi:hypothetical protein
VPFYVAVVALDNHWRMLFHFVDADRAEAVLGAREIGFTAPLNASLNRVTRQNLLWLTDTPDADVAALFAGQGAGTAAEAEIVRFTVQVARAQHWTEWARRHRVSGRVRRRLADLTGGISPWWVVPNPIPAADWISAEGVRSSAVFWPLTTADPSAATPSRSI